MPYESCQWVTVFSIKWCKIMEKISLNDQSPKNPSRPKIARKCYTASSVENIALNWSLKVRIIIVFIMAIIVHRQTEAIEANLASSILLAPIKFPTLVEFSI